MVLEEEWHGYKHRHELKFISKRKTRNSGWTGEGADGEGALVTFAALPGTWPGAISVPKVEKSAYYISEEQRAEKQEYRRSAARTLLAQGNLEVPGSSLEAQLPSKKRRRLSKRDEAFVSDSDDSRLAALSPSDQAESDLTDYCAAELVGFRSIVTPRDCRAAPTDEPLDFFSSRAFLQDLEPFYYRFFQHTPKTEAERLAPLDESKAEEYHYPLFILEYPGEGVREEFFLVKPRLKDAYDPIRDLHDTVRLILENFVTSEQCRDIFKCDPKLQPRQRYQKKKRKEASTKLEADAAAGLLPLEASPSDLLLRLDDAIHDADGDLFEQALDDFNRGMRQLKESGQMQENIRKMDGLKEAVWTRISSQAYDRMVSPRVGELRDYKPFSDEVYGELLAPFVYDIIHKADLRPGMTFVDLGSGVGNCLVQAALATGCRAFGIELQDTPAELADLQIKEVKNRARMYGVSMGECKSKKGDMLADAETVEYLRQADVVLVNNYAFKAETNLGLMQLFLELKDKCRVVSMQAFTGRNRQRESVRGGAHSILQQGEKISFGPDNVSWMPRGGTYYIGHIDRSKVAAQVAQVTEKIVRQESMQDSKKPEERDTSRDSTASLIAEDSVVLLSSPESGEAPPMESVVPDSQEETVSVEKVMPMRPPPTSEMFVQL